MLKGQALPATDTSYRGGGRVAQEWWPRWKGGGASVRSSLSIIQYIHVGQNRRVGPDSKPRALVFSFFPSPHLL